MIHPKNHVTSAETACRSSKGAEATSSTRLAIWLQMSRWTRPLPVKTTSASRRKPLGWIQQRRFVPHLVSEAGAARGQAGGRHCGTLPARTSSVDGRAGERCGEAMARSGKPLLVGRGGRPSATGRLLVGKF